MIFGRGSFMPFSRIFGHTSIRKVIGLAQHVCAAWDRSRSGNNP